MLNTHIKPQTSDVKYPVFLLFTFYFLLLIKSGNQELRKIL